MGNAITEVSISNRYSAILNEKILDDAKFIKVTVADKNAIVPITSKYIGEYIDNNGTKTSYISISYKLTSNLELGEFESMNLTLSDLDDNSTITESVTVQPGTIDLNNSGTLILMNWIISFDTLSSSNGGNQ